MLFELDDASDARRAEEEMIRRRREAAARWPTLLDEIRDVPGCEDFALPPPMEMLHAAAGDGTVVALTVTDYGCGALLLTRDDADYLELPALTSRAAAENAGAFLQAVTRDDDDTEAMDRVLGWLWDAVAGPVLDHLGHGPVTADPASSEGWPRVWWIPTGALSLLPLHAAGHHYGPFGMSVLDRVVSSYTPSLRALGDARARAAAPVQTTALAVGINSTTDETLAPLPRAEEEATRVHRRFDSAQTLLGAAATHDAVVAHLATAAWAHFACHGFADNTDPAQSFLALHDKQLRVGELFTMRLDNPYLAFLSACTTGVGSLGLLDESIHLASAFQLAGYPHVVATLWRVRDRLARNLAEDFYQAVHPTPTTWAPPAQALHTTIHAYRRRYQRNPHVWASHIHLGP